MDNIAFAMAQADYDSPWKEILEAYFPEFLAFFFPSVYADIDWQRPYEFLDKEFQQIVRDAEAGRRYADKLVKVFRRDGEEEWVLAHVEIQSGREKCFEERLFVYYYRIFDRYRRDVATFAVLTDGNNKWRPRKYRRSLWNCQLQFKFPTVKLLDYRGQTKILQESRNPFAIVVLVHLALLEAKEDNQQIFTYKVTLTRRLYEKGYSKQEVINLYRFIDWIMQLPEPLKTRYNQMLDEIEKEHKVQYITGIEERGWLRGLNEGRHEGRHEGRREGLAEGRMKGRLEGEITLLKRQLTRRFGPLPEWVNGRLADATPVELEQWGDRLLEAASLTEVFSEP